MFPLNVVAAAGESGLLELVAGASGLAAGYSVGLAIGTLDPDEFNTFTIIELQSADTTFVINYSIDGLQANADSSFESMQLTGTFSTGAQDFTLLRTAANYSQVAGQFTRWQWTSQTNLFVNGNTYAVQMS